MSGSVPKRKGRGGGGEGRRTRLRRCTVSVSGVSGHLQKLSGTSGGVRGSPGPCEDLRLPPRTFGSAVHERSSPVCR
eukprot:2344240-Pyramimonas_sp.AAC.1